MPFDGAFSPRATGTEGRLLIQAFEGFSPTVYICPAGYPTVGYGHVVLPGERFDQPLSQAEGDALLARDLPRYELAVCRLIGVPRPALCFDALVSFTFNLGEGTLAASTLRRLINAGRIRFLSLRTWKIARRAVREMSFFPVTTASAASSSVSWLACFALSSASHLLLYIRSTSLHVKALPIICDVSIPFTVSSTSFTK